MKHLKSFNESIEDDYKFFDEMIHTINDICIDMSDNGCIIKHLVGIVQINMLNNKEFYLTNDVKESIIRSSKYIDELSKTSFKSIIIGLNENVYNTLIFSSIEEFENYLIQNTISIKWILIQYNVL